MIAYIYDIYQHKYTLINVFFFFFPKKLCILTSFGNLVYWSDQSV